MMKNIIDTPIGSVVKKHIIIVHPISYSKDIENYGFPILLTGGDVRYIWNEKRDVLETLRNNIINQINEP